MVKAEKSWLFQQHSACDLPDLNCMSTLLQHGQHHVSTSFMNNATASAYVAFPGFTVPGLCGSGTGEAYGAHGLFRHLPTHLGSLPYSINPYVNGEPYASYHGHGAEARLNAVSGSMQKRFAIFDQSGNNTRMFFTPVSCPAQNLTIAPKESVNAFDFRGEGKLARMELKFPTLPAFLEKPDENLIIGKGSEMHENTEEINALLYSDDDGDDSEEDEVTSTGRSPFPINGSYKKRELAEMTMEFTSSDGPIKRQRLIDGGDKKSSLISVVNPMNMDGLREYNDDARSISARCNYPQGDVDSISGPNKYRKDNIRETLRVLKSLIPGLRSKDQPLLVIEEAISYLKYLKLNAEALGFV